MLLYVDDDEDRLNTCLNVFEDEELHELQFMDLESGV